MNYEAMSNFEINRAVAIAEGLEVAEEQYESYGDRDENVVLIIRGVGFGGRSYCNNPADAWPIIKSNNICIHNDERSGLSYSCSFDKFGYVSEEFYCDNTLRAAMVVFLMMHERSHNCPSAAC